MNKLRTPQEILAALNHDRQAFADKILAHVAKTLEASFVGEPIEIWFDEPKDRISSVWHCLDRECHASGWAISIASSHSDQRDGDSTSLRLSPLEPLTNVACK